MHLYAFWRKIILTSGLTLLLPTWLSSLLSVRDSFSSLSLSFFLLTPTTLTLSENSHNVDKNERGRLAAGFEDAAAAGSGEPVCVHQRLSSSISSPGGGWYGEEGWGEPQAGQRRPAHLHPAPHPHHPNHLALQAPALQVSARNRAGHDLWWEWQVGDAIRPADIDQMWTQISIRCEMSTSWFLV